MVTAFWAPLETEYHSLTSRSEQDIYSSVQSHSQTGGMVYGNEMRQLEHVRLLIPRPLILSREGLRARLIISVHIKSLCVLGKEESNAGWSGSHMLPVEAFATVIKCLIRKKYALLLDCSLLRLLIAWFSRVKGQTIATWFVDFSILEATLIPWSAPRPRKGFDCLIQFWSRLQMLLHRTYKWLPLDGAVLSSNV